MSHVFVLYAPSDHKFAHQLAVQIEQRGIRVWPVPNVLPESSQLEQARADGLETASHVLGIIPAHADDLAPLLPHCERALDLGKQVIVVLEHPEAIPDQLKKCRVINFEGHFLIAFEELSTTLKKTKAPTRTLTVEHPPPVAKSGLLPMRLPSERCWREDRLRVNYNLPIILTEDELQTRLPAFLAKTDFDLTQSTRKRLRARRKHQQFQLFDPRRAVHTIAVRRKRGHTQVHYRMTRLQVYYWLEAHYRVLDREAAALYRYLATGKLDAEVFEPVYRQARRARAISISLIGAVWVVLVTLVYLIAVF